MVENVQQIEAMLAAYIDGELTPDERAELERHLDANPSHRTLILELTGQRELLRSLPREPAPEDLSEPLEGAIERDALLGGGDPLTEFRTMRTRRWWPQLLAAAAIFILAFGLAAIVFYVLPPKHPTVAIVQPPDVDMPAEASELRERVAQVGDDVVRAAEPAGAVAPKLKAETESMIDPASGGVAMADAAAPDGALIITITANDLQQASGELRSYLSANGISWSEATRPEAVVTLAKATSVDVQGVSLARSAPPPTAAEGADRDEIVRTEGAQRLASAPPAPSPDGATRERRGVRAPVPAAAPSTAPVVTGEAPSVPGRAGNIAGTVEGTSGADHYVVLAALSGTQAARLADAFARPAAGLSSQVRREALAMPAVKQVATPIAVEAGATRRMRVGFTPQVRLDESIRPTDAEEFKLVRPATRPVDAVGPWLFRDEGSRAPTTRPVEPFALGLTDLGRELEGPVFNCVVVLRRPEEASAATRPAEATTRPIAPATLPVSTP